MRIKNIVLSWFRGAADPIPLEPDCKSMVVYGVNASGKSSFVDALEYVLNGGRIGHLADEYSGRHLRNALPNTHKPKDAKTGFSIKFCDDSELKTEIKDDGTAKSSGSMAASIGNWDYRRTVLRQDEVVAFIHDTKGGKYSALLPLFGLHQMEIAAENLRQLAKNVDSLSQIDRSKAILQQVKTKRDATFGADTDEEILRKIQELHGKYCADKLGAKDGLSRCAELTTSLQARTTQLSSDQKRYLVLRTIAEIEFKDYVDEIRASSVTLAGAVDPLIAHKLAVLQPTETLISKLTGDEKVECPACGQSIRVNEFREHVRVELERLGDIRETFNTRNTAMGSLCDAVRSLKINLPKPEVKTWRDELARGTLSESLEYLDGLNVDGLRIVCGATDLEADILGGRGLFPFTKP